MQTEARRAERGLSNRQSPKPYRPPARRSVFAVARLARAGLIGKVNRLQPQPKSQLTEQMHDPTNGSHPGQIVKSCYKKQRDDDCGAKTQPDIQGARRNRPAVDNLRRVEQQMPPVENGNGDQINQPEIDRQEGDEADDTDEPHGGDLAGDLGDTQRTGKLPQPLAMHHKPIQPGEHAAGIVPGFPARGGHQKA